MSESPPPPRAARPPVAGHAAAAAVIGLVFLMLAWPLVQWLGVRTGNPYGTVWQQGELAGQDVAYVDLDGGVIWRDIATFATAVVLLAEAAAYGAILLRPALAKTMLTAILAVTAGGVLVNVLGAAMQMRAGFMQPLYALIGAVLCVASILTALAHRNDVRELERLPDAGV